MDKTRLLKLGLKESDIEIVAYACLTKHIFKYRQILNSRHDYGLPNIEDRGSSYVNGILYNINDRAFENLISKRCKPSKNDKKYKYLLKDIDVFDYHNCSFSWRAKTFIIHPLRTGDEVQPLPGAFKHIIKTVSNIPNYTEYHIKCLKYITRY
jgi:hypothetical protein